MKYIANRFICVILVVLFVFMAVPMTGLAEEASEEIPVCEHESVTDAAVLPTCTSEGLTEGAHCSICGEVLLEQQTIAMADHSYGEYVVTTPATCDAAGIETKTCSVCGDEQTREVAVLEHSWNEGEITKDATLYEAGIKTYTCTVCDETKEENIEKLPSIASGTCGENLKWAIDEDYTLIISGTGAMTSYSSYPWHEYCMEIKNIVVADEVTSIGKGAFSGCSSLESITLPFVGGSKTSHTYLGYIFGASSYSYNSSYVPASLKEVIITGGERIAFSAFSGCSSIESITIPDSITSIGGSAFRGCSSLESITIPDSVTSIGDDAFRGCSSLESITLPFVGNSKKTTSDTKQYPFGYIFGASSYDGGVATKQYYYYSTSTTYDTYYIPASLKNVTITGGEILYGAFYNCSSLESITIPDSVTSISGNAFSGCSSLLSVTIPDSVTSIGSYAFSGCSSLESITIPESVTSIGDGAFDGCSSLESITLPFVGGSKTLNPYLGYIFGARSASYNSSYVPASLKEVIITGGERIVLYAFSGCSSIESITIPDSVTSIGGFAFSGCSNLECVTIPDSVTGIGDHAFSGCSKLKTAGFGNEYDINFGWKKSIPSYTFYNCSSLESITIPDSVTSIGVDAFYGCSSLKEVHISSIESWLNISFGDYASNPLYYASGGLYMNGEPIKNIVIPSTVTTINSYAFNNCSRLLSVTIPDSVTSIGISAFADCSNLKEINLPNSIYSIGQDAFDNVSATVFYACDSNIKLDNYGGNLTWILDHKGMTTDAYVAPTCTKPGLTAGSHCSACDAVFIEQKEISAVGHTEVIDAYVAPTCIKTGLTEGKHCLVCNDVLVVQYDIAANGHAEVIDAEQAPTCTKIGFTEGLHCSVCNEVLIAPLPISAKGHASVIDAAVAPTCTQTGFTDGKHCSACGEVLIAQQVVPANGHTVVTDKAVAATYTKTGKTQGSHCSVCGEVLTAQKTVAVKKLAKPTAKAVSYSYTTNKITWNKVKDATGYEVYQATSKSGTYKKIATIKSGSTVSYTKKSLKTGKTYYYKVRAIRKEGSKTAYSSYSSVVSAKPVPKTPTIKVSKVGTKSAKISWSKVSGATRYQIYRATSKNGTYKYVGSTKSTSYTNKKLTKGKRYYYKVRAYHVESGKKIYSSYSSKKSVKL